MPLGKEEGLSLGHTVVDGESAPPKKGHSPNFSAHVCCGQTAGWIKIPLGTKVGLGPGHIVLHEDPFLPKRGTAPNFRSMSVVAKRSPISATAERLFQLRMSTGILEVMRLNCISPALTRPEVVSLLVVS